MACAACERRRKQMKAYVAQKLEDAKRWAAVRAGKVVTSGKAEGAATSTASGTDQAANDSSRSAGKPSAEHRKQDVARDPAAGAAKGRVSVQGVRKAGGGKAGAR